MAANPHKGEIDIKAGSKTYTLCFTSNAIVQIEKLLGVSSIGEARLSSYDTVRTVIWGGLQKHHDDVDLIGAGDVMDDMMDDLGGGIESLSDPVVRALRFRTSGTALDVPIEVDTGDD